jgi:site-specific DNA recombinase
MSELVAALYARVSSEQQAEAQTIQSQLAALRARAGTSGVPVPPEREFVDDGYSGTTLVRPALERVRDLAALGGLDRLYVQSPDRLARKYAYQVLLLEEFAQAGVEVVFLNHAGGRSPEDELLLQVQGMVAEYERAQLLERSRRGRRHAARTGSVSVLMHAPYGYRYVTKHEGGGQARYEVAPEEAGVVRQIFGWVGRERAPLREVCRRLCLAGVRSPQGHDRWDPATVWGMLQNPAYTGRAVFGRTRTGPWQPERRPQRGHNGPPRRPVTPVAAPPEEWITIPVPALVDADLFAAAQEQLAENRQRARQSRRGPQHLLQGLLVCAHCGHCYYGTTKRWRDQQGGVREYGYYRCLGSEAYRYGGEARCANTPLYRQALEEAVWREVRGLLEDPARLEREYHRRLTAADAHADAAAQAQLEAQLGKVRRGLARLIDSYTEGLIEKAEFTPRLGRLRERVAALEGQLERLRDEAAQHAELRLVIGRLDEFAAKVRDGLASVDWATRREIICAVVKQVEIAETLVTVVFRAPPAGGNSRGVDISQDRERQRGIPLREGGPRDPRRVRRYDIHRLWLQRHRPLPPWRATPRPLARHAASIPHHLARGGRLRQQHPNRLGRLDEDLTAGQREYVAALLAAQPALAEARTLAREFSRLVREHDGAALEPWLIMAEAGQLAALRPGRRRSGPIF